MTAVETVRTSEEALQVSRRPGAPPRTRVRRENLEKRWARFERRPGWRGRAARFAPPIVLFCVFIALWEAACRLSGIKEYLLPAPSAIAAAALEHGPLILSATARTAAATLIAFAVSLLVGNLLAIALSSSRLLERSTYVYIVLLQTIPMVAITPFIIIWFGPTFATVVVVATVSAFFPILANSLQGLRSADQNLQELFVFLGASKLQTLIRLRLPSALPHLVTGARLGAVLAVIGVISGEFISGTGSMNPGIGFLILRSGVRLETALLFAAGIASALLGVVFNSLVRWVSERMLRSWHPSEMPA